MKREIKFKFWSPILKNMSPVANLGSIVAAGDNMIKLLNFITPLQFTGLLEKNGNEIYEGDILSFSFPLTKGKKNPIIHYHQVMWNSKHGAWWMKRGNTETQLGSHVFDHMIVGDIYQNPELLK